MLFSRLAPPDAPVDKELNITNVTPYAMPKIGDVIAGKYRLEKVAGEGGMGIVYLAEHLVLHQRVAVKVLLPDAASSEAIVERFTREARAAAKINSEHVARVLDAGSLTSGAPFLVMEYLDGCDLEELLDLQKTLSTTEVADYVVQALEGLAHAHAAGIIHRDLKPANLFLGCRPDGTNAIKLLDFGISKTKAMKPEDKRLTGHHVLGSPVYMSPEQLRNATDIDARADIWSIGVVAYELLVGLPPFDGDGVGEIFAAILEKEPLPLSVRNDRIPKELSDIIGKCLRRDRDERWADVGVLARALAPFGSDPDTVMVERAEQVLARAKLMSVPKTPIETLRIVEAIEAAAERAKAVGTTSAVALPLLQPKEGVGAPANANANANANGVSALRRYARRSPAVAVGAALALAAFLGLSAAFAFHAVRPVLTDNRHTPGASPTDVTTSPSPGLLPADVRGAPADEPAAVMELPPTPSAGRTPASRASKPTGKPQRPKFLNTRE